MTITINPARNEYTATAGQTIFNYTFKIYTANDLNVYITPAGQDANDSTDITTDYVVDPGTIGDENGGFITLNTGATLNDRVTIVSGIASNRTIDYQVSGDFTPPTINDDNDRGISLVKQVEDTSNRALVFQQSQQGTVALSLPAPSSQDFLRWKSDLSGLENVDGTNITDIENFVAQAATSAANAATSETNAATSETNAATSETNAATSETNAATSETNAATSAANSAISAANSAAAAQTVVDENLSVITQPYNLQSATYTGNSRAFIATEVIAPLGIIFNATGTKMLTPFAAGAAEFNLPEPFTFSTSPTHATPTWTGATSEDTQMRDMLFNNDETGIFMLGDQNDSVYEYSLPVTGTITTTPVYTGNSFSVAAQTTSPDGMFISTNDGLKLFVISSGDNRVYEYDMTTAWSLTTPPTYTGRSFLTTGQITSPDDVWFSTDGKRMFIAGRADSDVYEYRVAVPWSFLAAPVYTGKSFTLQGTTVGIAFNDDGRKLFSIDETAEVAYEYDTKQELITVELVGYRLACAGYTGLPGFDFSSEEAFVVAGLRYSNDGSKFFTMGLTSQAAYQYDLTTNHDPNTATYSGNSLSTAAQDTSPSMLSFNDDGLKFFAGGIATQTIYSYTVSSAFDFTVAPVYTGNSYSVAAQDAVPCGMDWNDNGTKMFVGGSVTGAIYQHTVTTGYLLTTASYSGNSLDVSGQVATSSLFQFRFLDNGYRVWVVCNTRGAVFEYSLSQAYEVGSGEYHGVTFRVTPELTPLGLDFNSDGSILSVSGNTTKTILQYNTSDICPVF